jgi:hypothetical protein
LGLCGRVAGHRAGRLRKGRLEWLAILSYRRGAGGTDNIGFNHNIARADEDQMFDIVAAHDEELAMAVEIETVDKP